MPSFKPKTAKKIKVCKRYSTTLDGKHKEFIGEIIDKFENNGYKVNHTYQVLNAANYGVPQNRERLFLLGCRQDLELPNYPEKITFSNQKSPTVWEALQDLPAIESYPELSQQDWIF